MKKIKEEIGKWRMQMWVRFLNSQGVSNFYGAKSHKLMTSIIHIIRGEIKIRRTK